MDGKTRWRGWLVPWVLGAAMQGGCQLLQPSTTAEPPLAGGSAAQDRLVAVAAQSPTDAAASRPLPVSTMPTSGGQSGSPQAFQSGPVVSQAAYPPPSPMPPPLLPPPVNVSPLPTQAPSTLQPTPANGPTITFLDANAADGHQLRQPPGGGAILNLAPGEQPVQRLAEVTLRLQAREEEAKRLEARLQQLTAILEQRGQTVSQSTREVQEATEEIRKTRTTLQATRQEVDDAWAALRRREKEDIETMKECLRKMERPPENLPPSPGNEDHAPARP
jgi:hypothetical protein